MFSKKKCFLKSDFSYSEGEKNNDTALIMSVTVYFDKGIRTERVRDAINTSVFEALAANGIEIPYNYMNVVLHNH